MSNIAILLVLFSALLFKLCFLCSHSLVFMLTIAFLPSSQRWWEWAANSRNKIARESFAIRLSEEPKAFLWVCPLYFASLGDWAVIACLRIITREDSPRSPAPQSPALRQAPQPQCSATEEWRMGGEEQRKRDTDWVVIKGLFFLLTEEHLHSSHLLRRDCATVCVFAHTLTPACFISERPASAACAFPQRSSESACESVQV